MGGGPCKVLIDENASQAMAKQFEQAMEMGQRVINNLWEYLTEAEKAEALELSYDVCEFADGPLRKMTKRVIDWYVKVGTAHAHDGEYVHQPEEA